MIRKYVVLVTWRRLKQADLAPFVVNVITQMTGNVYFPNPTVKLSDLENAANRYSLSSRKPS